VYAAGVVALKVMKQPPGKYTYVSSLEDTVTLFQSAMKYGVTGLLAHNYLAGRLFSQLKAGQEVIIIYGKENIRRYQVTEYAWYKKITPNSPTSDLIDLETGENATCVQVFNRFYTGKHRVTFQTCLAGEGIDDYGLMFVIAQPVDSH
jgi:hypothetical protein